MLIKKQMKFEWIIKNFADENWNVKDWWNFTQSGPEVIENNGLIFY